MDKLQIHLVTMEETLRKVERATADELWRCLLLLLREQMELNRLLLRRLYNDP